MKVRNRVQVSNHLAKTSWQTLLLYTLRHMMLENPKAKDIFRKVSGFESTLASLGSISGVLSDARAAKAEIALYFLQGAHCIRAEELLVAALRVLHLAAAESSAKNWRYMREEM